jgi:selenocysteine-specific elongation factor
MHVIGTAGHVDHGKSTLVKILTGINPDRLQEEQEREMTIDLGFAWLDLPGGKTVSIVDVPGHEDFIRNMLAGIGAVDAAMLIVAADEGVMPQTREHIAILNLLKVKAGLVALTKSDLVEDEEWLELVEQDVRDLLAPTSLSGATIIRVSARTKQGIPELIAELTHVLSETPERRDLGRPRLPIDRVFTIAGFGTVVTGTLIDGTLHNGDEVQAMPNGLKARIRGLQSHRTKVEAGLPGSRLAINLSGISTDQLKRGDVIIHPGCLSPTLMADVQLEVLPEIPFPLRHNMELEFFSGSGRIAARARVLGVPEISPGDSGWAQLCFDEPAVLAKGDRFILRQFSPGRTIGGGLVVEPHPQRRHPRFRQDVLGGLEKLAHGTPEEVLFEILHNSEPLEAGALALSSNLAAPIAECALENMISQGSAIILGRDSDGMSAKTALHARRYLITNTGWRHLIARLTTLVQEYHIQYPLRIGMPREELKSRLRLDPRPFTEIVALAAKFGHIVEAEFIVHLPGHIVSLTPAQQNQLDRIMDAFRENRFAPPSIREVRAEVGDELAALLLERGALFMVNQDLYFLKETFEEIVAFVIAHIRSHGSLSVAEMRDRFGMSRKYILPLLDHLDAHRITKRIGDDRVLVAQ